MALKTPVEVQVAPATPSTSYVPALTISSCRVFKASPPIAGVSFSPVSSRPTILSPSKVTLAVIVPPYPSAEP